MGVIEDMIVAIVVGATSGVIYYLFTKDSNGATMISIIVSQVSYHGSTGSAKK